MDVLDRRLHPFRPDLASVSLKNIVDAETYTKPIRKTVTSPVLDLYLDVPSKNGLASQLLRGEKFDVFDIEDGFAWGQSETDGYVGYVPVAGLGAYIEPEIIITAQLAHVYPEPSIKSTPLFAHPFLAKVSGSFESGTFLELDDGFVCASHVAPLQTKDPTSIAERFLGAPYLWGGRSQLGLDCSALVQLAHLAIGVECPRDSDMQLNEFGEVIEEHAALKRGDLIFWTGHVGIMQNETTLLHANAHHMQVTSEPLSLVADRIRQAEGNDIAVRKRLKFLQSE